MDVAWDVVEFDWFRSLQDALNRFNMSSHVFNGIYSRRLVDTETEMDGNESCLNAPRPGQNEFALSRAEFQLLAL